MITSLTPDDVAGYVRLSRDDLRAPGSLERKFQNRREQCMKLARDHNLPLLPENILCERESGTKLATRPHAQSLLARARAGTLKVLITPAQDRLTRGDKRDEADIEDALCAGRVTLVTASGVVDFDDNYDVQSALVFGINAVVARNYVAGLVKKRKDADRERLRAGIRTRGYAPYGYRYLRPTYDALGRQLTPQQHEIIADKYEIVCELFRRARTESMNQIMLDFNRRGVPPPGRPDKEAKRWYRTTLSKILSNPWYAGYIAQRHKVDRAGKQRRLEKADYILADVEGEWPHPISLAEWYTIQQVMQGNYSPTNSRGGLLTRVLHCPQGASMFLRGKKSYGCRCAENGQAHLGKSTTRERIDDWVRDIVTDVIAALPTDVLSAPQKPIDRKAQEQAFGQARQRYEERKSELTQLIRQSASLTRRFAASDFDDVIRAVTQERDAARLEMEAAQAQLRLPDTRQARTLIERVRTLGMARFWDGDTDNAPAPLEVQRALVTSIIAHLQLDPLPEGRTFYRSATVTLHDWAQMEDFTLRPFPLTTREVWNVYGEQLHKGEKLQRGTKEGS